MMEIGLTNDLKRLKRPRIARITTSGASEKVNIPSEIKLAREQGDEGKSKSLRAKFKDVFKKNWI